MTPSCANGVSSLDEPTVDAINSLALRAERGMDSRTDRLEDRLVWSMDGGHQVCEIEPVSLLSLASFRMPSDKDGKNM